MFNKYTWRFYKNLLNDLVRKDLFEKCIEKEALI